MLLEFFKIIRKFLYKSSTLESLGESFGKMASKAGQWIEDIAKAIREFLPEGATNFVVKAGNFLEGIFVSLPRVLGYIAPLVSLIVVIANIITLIDEPKCSNSRQDSSCLTDICWPDGNSIFSFRPYC